VRRFLAGSGGRMADLVVREGAGEGVAGVCRAGGSWNGEVRILACTEFSEFRHGIVSNCGAPPIDLSRVV
jgi:hypothetical protein